MPRVLWLVLFFIALAVLVPGTSLMPLLDRDEPRFSRATVEMEQRGDYVVPYFNDEYRFDKPPLTYWWMHVNYAVFGHNELGARMHSVLAAVVVALLLLAMGREFFGWRAGFWAGVAWVTLFQVWQHGRLAVADMPMVLFLTLAHWALWKLLTAGTWRRWGVWFWVLWLSLSLGFLAKGPLVFFSVIFTLVLLRWVFWRRPLEWGRLQILPGAAICLLPIALWGIPALVESGGLFWTQGMERHVVDRGLEAFNNRATIPVLFYLVTALVSLFPWVGRAGAAWPFVRGVRSDMRAAFLVSWAVGPYLIFAFYATQLPHYVLPAFPAVMLMLFSRPAFSGKGWRRWFLGYHCFFGVVVVALALWLLMGPVLAPVRVMMLGFCGVLMGMLFAAVNFEAHRLLRVGLGLALLILGSVTAGYGMRRIALSPAVAHLAEGTGGVLCGVGYSEPSLVYYSSRSWKMFHGKADGLQEAVAEHPAMLVVLRCQKDTGAMLGFGSKKLKVSEAAIYAESLLKNGYVRTTVEGLNIARFSWATVDVYLKSSPENALP